MITQEEDMSTNFKSWLLTVLLLGLTLPTFCAVNFTKTVVTASANLALVTFNYDLTTGASGDSGNYNVQGFFLNADTGKYVEVNPGINYTVPILPNTENVGSFSVVVPVGHYTSGKLSLFPVGTNYSAGSQDITVDSLNLTVTTTQTVVSAATLTIGTPVSAPGTLTIPYTIKTPAGPISGIDVGYLMAKGSGGFVQVAISQSDFKASNDPLDNYNVAAGSLVVDTNKYTNSVPGVYNLQYGIFTNSWALKQWIYPGTDFEIGGSSWVVKADPAKYPNLAAALLPPSATCPGFIGMNEGNDLASLGSADQFTLAHLKILKSKGATVMRESFDADKMYASLTGGDNLYFDKVDQLVQNELAAGFVPELQPQDMPTGADPAGELRAIDVALATKYLGVPVIYGLLNEPHAMDWPTWKTLGTSIAAAVKQANPKAIVVLDAEGYAKSLDAVIASPPDLTIIDLIGWHPYVSAAVVAATNFGALPVYVEEYHDATPEFHQALEKVKPRGIAAWAWNFPGRDSLNLVQSINGALETYTPDGDKILGYYATWMSGAAVQLPPPPPPPPPSIDSLIARINAQDAQISAQDVRMNAQDVRLNALEYNYKVLKGRVDVQTILIRLLTNRLNRAKLY